MTEIFDSSRLLAGVRVVDLTSIVFGPLATQMLADYGADVLKVEPLSGDIMRYAGTGSASRQGMGPIFLNLNRGKKSIAVDLKTASGRKIVYELIRRADIFVHNIRRSAVLRLGLDYQTLKTENPKLIYCAATGFTAGGERENLAALDEIIQASAGILQLGLADDDIPKLIPNLLADKVSGYGLACAILAALNFRDRTNSGIEVDLSMHATISSFALIEHLQGLTYDPPQGDVGYQRLLHNGRRLFKSKDGVLAICPYSTEHWYAVFRFIKREDLINDVRFSSRLNRNTNISELYSIIESAAANYTTSQWENAARKYGFAAHRVVSLREVTSDQDLLSAGIIDWGTQAGVGKVRRLSSPGVFNGSVARSNIGAPGLGEHTLEVLSSIGIDQDSARDLHRDGVVSVFDLDVSSNPDQKKNE